jgi:hypothetical protein
VEQPPGEAAVLVDERPVEAEPVVDERDRLRGRQPPGDRPGRVVRGHEEQQEHRHADDPQHQQPEQAAPDEEGGHRAGT